MSYYEHHKRSIAKTIGFQALVIAADAIVVYLITGKYEVTFTVIVFTNLVSGIIYFLHERAWNRIHWGKSKLEIELK
jgi:adenylylsulfate kinase